jgi:hypothetical protein
MITCESVYNKFLNLCRQDKRGLSVSIDEFNYLIDVINQEIYSDYYDKFEESIANIDTMGSFKIINYSIALVAGVGDLPANYYHIIGKPRVLETNFRVDIITEYEDACREDDAFSKATLLHPTCVIGGLSGGGAKQVRVKPTTITGLWIDYLRGVTTPYLDWYVNDTNLNYSFLPDTGVAQAIPVGSTYRDGTPGTGLATTTSLTNDLEWDTEDQPLILGKLLKAVGIQLPDEGLANAGATIESQILEK